MNTQESKEMSRCSKCGIYENTVFKSCPVLLGEIYFATKQVVTFEPNEFLFHEGKEAFGAYCISSGEVNLVKRNKDGKTHVMNWASSGNVLGICALLKNGFYTVSAIALTSVRACFIPKADFLEMLKSEKNNCFLSDALEAMCKEMEWMENKLMRAQSD